MSKLVGLIGELGGKVIDLFSKKAKNGEKSQDLQVKKLNIFNKCLVNIMYIILGLIVLNTIFPGINAGEWIYNIFELILKHMIGGE
jgi:hypothetical protein